MREAEAVGAKEEEEGVLVDDATGKAMCGWKE